MGKQLTVKAGTRRSWGILSCCTAMITWVGFWLLYINFGIEWGMELLFPNFVIQRICNFSNFTYLHGFRGRVVRLLHLSSLHQTFSRYQEIECGKHDRPRHHGALSPWWWTFLKDIIIEMRSWLQKILCSDSQKVYSSPESLQERLLELTVVGSQQWEGLQSPKGRSGDTTSAKWEH